MDSSEFKKLLAQNESETIDFKRDQYNLDDDHRKSKFIKDVLAMANGPLKGRKHIILGVKAYLNGSKDLVGIKESRDDEQFQSIIRDKVHHVPNFLYEPVEYNGQQYGVITIFESRKRPHMPKKNFGILKEGQVYIRRGTKNDVAGPDEIERVFRIRDLEDALEPISETKCRKIEYVYVSPQQYKPAVKILEEKGLVIILGPPDIGKTALGLYLLIQLKKEGRITDFYGFSEYQKLEKLQSLELKDYGIFMDDPFGKNEFTARKIGDDFVDIINLSKFNFVVITSRIDVFERAWEFTKMGEMSEKLLEEHIFRLDEHESYTKEDLIQVLKRHLDYSFEIQKDITKGEYHLARLHKNVIVSSLVFPHNIERLVSLHLKDVGNESDLREAIQEAKEIQNVAGRWFAHLDLKQEKYFVLAVTLFNGIFEEENFDPILNDLFSIYKIEGTPRLADLRRATKHWITTDGKVGFIHQDYYEGVSKEIRKNNYGPYKEDLLLLSNFHKDLVEDKDPYIRFAVTRPLCELAHIDTSKALPLVLTLIDDIDPFVQEYAIFPLKEIAKIDYGKVKKRIENLSMRGGVVAKQQVAFLFKEIGPQRPGDALPILEELIRERTALVWRAAAYAVGTIGSDHPEMVLPIVKQLAEEKFSYLRQAAALIARDVGKVNFEELKPIFKQFIANGDHRVRQAASRTIREIGYEIPDKVLDFADELSKDANPSCRKMGVFVLDDLGSINKERGISILDPLTKDDALEVRACAKQTLKKLELGEDFYPYEKLITSVPSIVDMDKGEVTPHFYELKEKSLGKDFNRALCQGVISPLITQGDADNLKKFLRIISPHLSKFPVLANVLKTIYKFSNKDSENAISFLVKWHEIDKGNVFQGLRHVIHCGSGALQRFMAQCCSKIYEKNNPGELFDRIEKWMMSERVVSERSKKNMARGIFLILKELSIIHLNAVIELLQGWIKTRDPYILNISMSTLVEIPQFEPNKVVLVARNLLGEGNETTRKMIFYVFSKIGQKEPEKVLPILKDLASHDMLIVRQNISTVLGEIGKYHPEKVLNSLREWAEDEELLNLKTVPHALQSIFGNNRSRQVLIALEQWRDPTNELVTRTIEATYERLEKEIPKEEIEKRVRKIGEKNH